MLVGKARLVLEWLAPKKAAIGLCVFYLLHYVCKLRGTSCPGGRRGTKARSIRGQQLAFGDRIFNFRHGGSGTCTSRPGAYAGAMHLQRPEYARCGPPPGALQRVPRLLLRGPEQLEQ